MRELFRRPSRVRRVVSELVVLDEVPDDIDAEAVDAAVEPEAKHVVHRLPHRLVSPVEVRLLLEEGVVVILSSRLVPFAGARSEEHTYELQSLIRYSYAVSY